MEQSGEIRRCQGIGWQGRTGIGRERHQQLPDDILDTLLQRQHLVLPWLIRRAVKGVAVRRRRFSQYQT